MLGEISSLVSSLTAIKSLGGALIDERDRQKAATIQIDLTNQILEAQAKLSQVLGTIIDKDGLIQTLTERVRDLEAKQSEKARYRLAKIGVVGEQRAYELRPSSELVERADEIAHFVCQPCFDGGKKSVLQFAGRYATCNLCKVAIQTELLPPRPRAVVSSF